MLAKFSQSTDDGSKREKDADYASYDGFYLRHYPATLIVLLAWISYIVLLLFLLNDISNPPAGRTFGTWEERLAELMLIVFAQAHGPVTAGILARLAISSLQSVDTAPRTWAELFWLADRSWQGPVSISGTYLTMARRHIRPSTTFVLFTAAYALTITTPSIITKAWPSGTILVPTSKTISIDSFSTLFNIVDNNEQMATGEGTWTSGLSIIDIYNSSIYNASDASPGPGSQIVDDCFIGSDAYGMDVTSMPGIWLRGGCQPISDPPIRTETDGKNGFDQLCSSINSTSKDWFILNATNPLNVSVDINWCTDFTDPSGHLEPQWADDTSKSLTTVMAFVNSTVGTNSVAGYLNCSASFLTGQSDTSGLYQTFSRFQQKSYLNASSDNDYIPMHPLVGAFFSITQLFNASQGSDESLQRAESILRMLGYRSVGETVEPTIQVSRVAFHDINVGNIDKTLFLAGGSCNTIPSDVGWHNSHGCRPRQPVSQQYFYPCCSALTRCGKE
jgi:hypothetical protein